MNTLGSRRLPLSTALVLSCALFGCEQKDVDAEPTVTKSRSQAVEASGPATVTAATATAAKPAVSAAAATKPARKLCQGQLGDGKALPKKPIFTRSASGAPELEAVVPSGGGKWTWLNFWAAWCVPCKEEIPRLLGWQSKLSSKMRVAFVSIDDDQRQLEQFLNTQPTSGLQSTLWLREGKEREDWLLAASQNPDPELPLHLLIDPKGKVVCTVQGAVEDSDFDAVRAIVGG
ncbi:MAG TPA: TlpA disulfide reductase family protein [Polyangiaceae bacterium]|nr:TlpA disulfide reductase family protein [Polyangiaceae bacterium]